MSESSAEPSSHPIRGCVATMDAALDEIADLDPVFMATREKDAALREIAAVGARLDALRLRVMAAASDVVEEAGAKDIGAWCVAELRVDGRDARADARLATSLDRRWSRVADALAEGACSLAQAGVITRALDDLPDTLEKDLVDRAEEHLVALAQRFGPRQLRRLGAKILEVVAPEIAEEELGRRLLAEEERARRRTSLSITDAGDGTYLGRFRVAAATGVRLKTFLEAFTQPRLAQLAEQGKTVPYPRLLGQAFCQLLERIDPDQLPHHGGDATTVVVTINADQLTKELGTATLGGGADPVEISAGEARRLACEAGIIPAVLGSDSEVLDLGRKVRLFVPVQRKALRIQFPTCAVEGCDVPNTWTEIHHLEPWSAGGKTNLRDGVLLCTHHHHLAHNPAFILTRQPDGSVRFHRRT